MKNIILFDLDGTLIDSTDAIINTFNFSFNQLSFDFKGNDEDIKQLIGYPLDIMYAKLGVPNKNIQKFVDSYKNRYQQISLKQTYLLNDAIQCLKLASTFARLGIVTTKTTQYTTPILKNMDILKYFEVIIGRQEVIHPKPHPEPILKAMQLMNINNKNYNIYMVGDTKLDLIAANDAGVNSVGVLCGYGSLKNMSKYSNMIYDTTLQAVQNIQIDIINNK